MLIATALALAPIACSGGSSSPATTTTDAGASGGNNGTGGSSANGGTGGSSANGGTGGSSASGGTGGSSASGGTGGTGACSQTLCGGKCVDTQTDNANCGTCGTACAQGMSCQSGACKPQPGAFGAPCSKNGDCNSQLCLQNGLCSKQCTGASDCPPAPEWSCAPLPGYPQMCQCQPSGQEVCDGRDNDCDGLVDNGATCSQTGYTCQNGQCACDPQNLCGGTCVDKQTDVNNCGTCGNKCATGASCQGGTCACPSGRTVCGGTCADKQTDVNNCGTCGNKCAAPTTACVAGQCACPNAGIECNGACVPSDSSNCGACGHTCGAGEVCGGSACGSEWADWPMPNPPNNHPALPNPASYDTSTPGVVVDKVTGLMWQRAVDANSYTWANAMAYCTGLSLAGYSDWRLPTEIELYSLVDYMTQSPPTIDTTAFPNTPVAVFWSSSPLAGNPSSEWYVEFGGCTTNYSDVGYAHRVRCVR